jgi:hypothetical protein
MDGKIENISETFSETQCECRPDNFKTISFWFHENYAIQNCNSTCYYPTSVSDCEQVLNKK